MNVTKALGKFGKRIIQLFDHVISEDEKYRRNETGRDIDNQSVDPTITWIEDHNEKSINHIIFEENK